jgi:hypothetical protein
MRIGMIGDALAAERRCARGELPMRPRVIAHADPQNHPRELRTPIRGAHRNVRAEMQESSREVRG